MAQEVVIYHSAMAGAPSATVNVLGGLTAILDACLVNGFASVGISTMTRVGALVTVVTASSHTYATGDVAEISGADQVDYNGRPRITVTAPNAFTFPIATTPVTPATGAMTVKRPAAGWTKPITGTNLGVYRTKTPGSNGHYLQVEDTNAYADANVSARVRMVVAATALDAGDQLGEQIRIQKANGGWVLVADSRTCYLIFNASNTLMFGEFDSYKAADGYNFFVSRGEAGSATDATSSNFCGRHFPSVGQPNPNFNTTNHGAALLRSHSQAGGSVGGSPVIPMFGPSSAGVSGGTTAWQGSNQPAISPVDSSVPCVPVFLTEISVGSGSSSAYVLRGKLRGAFFPMGLPNPAAFTNNIQALDDVTLGGDLLKIALVRFGVSGNAALALDLGEVW